jgi:exosortase
MEKPTHKQWSDSPSIQPSGVHSPNEKKQEKIAWLLMLLPLGYLWFRLISNLQLEWNSNPQYSYGLVVPLLVVGLILRRWHQAMRVAQTSETSVKASWWLMLLVPAFLYLPTRLVEAATPEWRPIQWLLGFEAIGLTLFTIYFAKGKACLRELAFPICFFIVAIPWPTLFETPIIQGLSRLNAAMVVEVMGILGVPAIQHGNVIEISTGSVGINDACSGIRSFQSSLMVSLFLGEFYMMSWQRRVLLVPVGCFLAMFFNLCRASLLTMIAAKKGVAAIATYHDEAGFTILLACTLTLWAAAALLNLRRSVVVKPPSAKVLPAGSPAGRRNLVKLAGALILWLVMVETGVELWYYIRESHIAPGPRWTVNLPTNNPTYSELPLTADEHILLRFDDGKQGQWREADGTAWQAYYFNWMPGRVAGYLAKRHTPDICLTATGLKMISGPDLTVMDIHGVRLPMRYYVFDSAAGQLQVYQCHWDPGAGQQTYANESSRFNLIRGIWAGRGNKGQKVLEVIISGSNDPESARNALIQQLDKIVEVEKS